ESRRWTSKKMDGRKYQNFGRLTVKMMEFTQKDYSVNVLYNSEVTSVRQNKQKQWDVCVRNRAEGWIAEYTADFLFIGAGGNAIPLLQKSKIRQSKHIGGFPISGQFLYCDKPDVVR